MAKKITRRGGLVRSRKTGGSGQSGSDRSMRVGGRRSLLSVGEAIEVLDKLRHCLPSLPKVLHLPTVRSTVIEIRAEIVAGHRLSDRRARTPDGDTVQIFAPRKSTLAAGVKLISSEQDLVWRWPTVCAALRVMQIQEQGDKLKSKDELSHESITRFLLQLNWEMRDRAAQLLLEEDGHQPGWPRNAVDTLIPTVLQSPGPVHWGTEMLDRSLIPIGLFNGACDARYVPQYELETWYLSDAAKRVLKTARELGQDHELSMSGDLLMVALLRASEICARASSLGWPANLSELLLVKLSKLAQDQPEQSDWLLPAILYKAGAEALIGKSDSPSEHRRQIQFDHLLMATNSTAPEFRNLTQDRDLKPLRFY